MWSPGYAYAIGHSPNVHKGSPLLITGRSGTTFMFFASVFCLSKVEAWHHVISKELSSAFVWLRTIKQCDAYVFLLSKHPRERYWRCRTLCLRRSRWVDLVILRAETNSICENEVKRGTGCWNQVFIKQGKFGTTMGSAGSKKVSSVRAADVKQGRFTRDPLEKSFVCIPGEGLRLTILQTSLLLKKFSCIGIS